MDTPDYSKHSAGQLRQILGRIDADRFPARVAEIEARLAALAVAVPDAAAPQPTLIAPIWRRLLAFIIDLFLLGLLGTALGALLHAQFTAMGPWGRLVGFVITLLYFDLTQSHLRGGQSAGMPVPSLMRKSGLPGAIWQDGPGSGSTVCSRDAGAGAPLSARWLVYNRGYVANGGAA